MLCTCRPYGLMALTSCWRQKWPAWQPDSRARCRRSSRARRWSARPWVFDLAGRRRIQAELRGQRAFVDIAGVAHGHAVSRSNSSVCAIRNPACSSQGRLAIRRHRTGVGARVERDGRARRSIHQQEPHSPRRSGNRRRLLGGLDDGGAAGDDRWIAVDALRCRVGGVAVLERVPRLVVELVPALLVELRAFLSSLDNGRGRRRRRGFRTGASKDDDASE